MTTRRDVDSLMGQSRDVSELAIEQLALFFATLDLSRPEAARDALVEVVPEIVREFGPVAGTVAAEWFEDLRAATVGGAFAARLGADADPDAVAGSVRALVSPLWTDAPDTALDLLAGSVQRHITYSARTTVARNAAHDPAQPRFARVPRGPKTCAWCGMLASRGFVYHSKATAGDQGRGVGADFHDDCDCAVVVEWDRDQEHIAGYDPDKLYDQYQEARAAAGSGSMKAIAAELRSLFPDDYKDGAHEHA